MSDPRRLNRADVEELVRSLNRSHFYLAAATDNLERIIDLFRDHLEVTTPEKKGPAPRDGASPSEKETAT